MRKARIAILATTFFGALLAGVPVASADSYTLEYTYSTTSGHCKVWQNVYSDSTDGYEYQQGHALSYNGDLCLYTQYVFIEGYQQSNEWSYENDGASAWSPMQYDGPGYTVEGCIQDLSINAAKHCTNPH